MNRRANKSKVFSTLAGTALVFVLSFQNCSKIDVGDMQSQAFAATVAANDDSLANEQLELPQDDISSMSENANNSTTSTTVPSIDCGNRVKNARTGACEDFKCKLVIEIKNPNNLYEIPARGADGICYAYKIMSGIIKSESALTVTKDADIYSRIHGVNGGLGTRRHPYSMGKASLGIRILGARSVKLTGGLSASDPILVDNFVLIGLSAADENPYADPSKYFKVMGTADSSLADDKGKDTSSIEFTNTLIPVIPYAAVGTSSVAPVDVSNSISIDKDYKLDIRALDCGGLRELSDIYLLFQ